MRAKSAETIVKNTLKRSGEDKSQKKEEEREIGR